MTFIICNFPHMATAQVKKDMSLPKKNLAAFAVIEKAFETGDTSKINSVVATDFIEHSERGELNRDSLKSMVLWMHTQMANMKTVKVSTVADDNYVMALRHYTGTSDGSPGMPPKGESYNMKSVEVARFKNGKAVEHWVYMEMTDMMKMMVPPSDGK